MSTIGSHFDVQLGKMLDSARNVGEPKVYLGNRAIQWGRIDLSAAGVVPMTRRDQVRFRLRRNDLLVCEGGEIGRAALWQDQVRECYYQKALHRLRPKASFEPRVMLALLEYWASTNAFANFVTQTSIAHLPREKFVQMPLPVIPALEQSHLAEILEDVDALIASLGRLITKKQAVKQGVMQQLLTGGSRLPGFTGVWENQPLREDIALISGHHVLAQYCNTRGHGVPYLTGPSDFPDGHIRQTKFTDRPTSLCQANDILVTVKGSGAGTLVEADAAYCISRQLMAMRTKKWNSRFVLYSLLRNASNIKDAVTGLIPGLSRSDILDQIIPVPPIDEQRAIVAVISDLQAELDSFEVRLTKTRDIKQGVMQQLLTGRTRLPAQEAA